MRRFRLLFFCILFALFLSLNSLLACLHLIVVIVGDPWLVLQDLHLFARWVAFENIQLRATWCLDCAKARWVSFDFQRLIPILRHRVPCFSETVLSDCWLVRGFYLELRCCLEPLLHLDPFVRSLLVVADIAWNSGSRDFVEIFGRGFPLLNLQLCYHLVLGLHLFLLFVHS